MSDRIFALACLAVCVVVLLQMWQLSVPFAYEPVGPKAFPVLLSLLMALCCLYLLVRPDRDISWPPVGQVIRGAALVGLLLLYARTFDLLGFPLATVGMVFAMSLLFGGRWWAGLISSLLIGLAGYFLFDRVLEVSLPLGRLWS